jgi:hypothetical protein
MTDLRQERSRPKEWQPMRLVYVGQVAELMRGGTGSRNDGGNPGFNKGLGT